MECLWDREAVALPYHRCGIRLGSAGAIPVLRQRNGHKLQSLIHVEIVKNISGTIGQNRRRKGHKLRPLQTFIQPIVDIWISRRC